MSELTSLETIELLPVVELAPTLFAKSDRPLPSGTGPEEEIQWHRYWLDSLADSGVVGLIPLRPASWMVTTRQLTGRVVLDRVLSTIVREWGGPEAFSAPDCKPVLDGGLALYCGDEVLVAPTCCCDLGNLSEWREAAAYRLLAWKMVWVGHPWVSVRFDGGRLVFSEPHESDSPVPRWMVSPEELGRAVAAAEAELEDFASRLQPVLEAFGGVAAPDMVSRRLAGLMG